MVLRQVMLCSWRPLENWASFSSNDVLMIDSKSNNWHEAEWILHELMTFRKVILKVTELCVWLDHSGCSRYVITKFEVAFSLSLYQCTDIPNLWKQVKHDHFLKSHALEYWCDDVWIINQMFWKFIKTYGSAVVFIIKLA